VRFQGLLLGILVSAAPVAHAGFFFRTKIWCDRPLEKDPVEILAFQRALDAHLAQAEKMPYWDLIGDWSKAFYEATYKTREVYEKIRDRYHKGDASMEIEVLKDVLAKEPYVDAGPEMKARLIAFALVKWLPDPRKHAWQLIRTAQWMLEALEKEPYSARDLQRISEAFESVLTLARNRQIGPDENNLVNQVQTRVAELGGKRLAFSELQQLFDEGLSSNLDSLGMIQDETRFRALMDRNCATLLSNASEKAAGLPLLIHMATGLSRINPIQWKKSIEYFRQIRGTAMNLQLSPEQNRLIIQALRNVVAEWKNSSESRQLALLVINAPMEPAELVPQSGAATP
jgi:hypothetical protein